MLAKQWVRIAVVIGMVLAVVGAQAKVKKSDPGPHPLKLLRFLVSNDPRSMSGTSGKFEGWLQNTSQYIVDKVHVDVEIYTRDGRYLDKVTKNIDKMKPGQKMVLEMRYSVAGGEETIAPRVWVYYNAGKDRLTQFEVPSSDW